MITCDRCGAKSPGESRFCDACGAALWMAGRSSGSLSGSQSNGSNGKVQKPAVSLAQTPSHVSAEITSMPPLETGGPVHATLVIERGLSAGKKFQLSNAEANIGRWDADGGVFPDVDLDSDDPEAKVSRRHCKISFRDGDYSIEDLGSTNGTFVNRGHRLVPGHRHPLKDGDEIIIGKTFLRFRVAK